MGRDIEGIFEDIETLEAENCELKKKLKSQRVDIYRRLSEHKRWSSSIGDHLYMTDIMEIVLGI